MLAFEDTPCIQADMEEVHKVYKSDTQIRLGPHDIPCMAYVFVVKRKSGMEIYLSLYSRDIKRALIYRIDPEKRNIGDPSSQLKTGLDQLKGLGFSLESVNLKFSAAMLEVVLQDMPVLMTPAKAKKLQMERNANLSALESQAAFLEENDLLEASESQLSKLPKEDRNRYNTAVAAYKKLATEDGFDEEREFLFDHVDALLHGRTPPKPGQQHAPTREKDAPAPAPKDPEQPKVDKKSPPPQAKSSSSSSTQKQAAAKPEGEKTASDPRDKKRIKELEDKLDDLNERYSELEEAHKDLESKYKTARAKLKKLEEDTSRVKEMEVELEAAHHDNDEAQKEIRRLKSENAKANRKNEELEDQLAQGSPASDEPVRPRSRLNTGRSLLSSSKSMNTSSKQSGDPPHVVRRPPPAGATFGVDWDLERLPCESLEHIVELHQSICNAQLTLEGYQTQYCAAYIAILKEGGGRQLYMTFRLPQDDRYLIYKPIKKPTSSGEIAQLMKEAQKFLQVVGVETEKVALKPGENLPDSELEDLFDCA